MARIFISYRRSDEPGYALALARDLTTHFGVEEVFKDVDTLEPGIDFVERIEDAVGSAEVLIALIGGEWLGTDSQGRRRIDEPKDFVRLEVGTALNRKIRVVPVLVRDARMPKEEDLPEDLAALSRRHALTLDDAMWATGIERLVRTIESVLADAEKPQLPERARTTQPLGESNTPKSILRREQDGPRARPAGTKNKAADLAEQGWAHYNEQRYEDARASFEQALKVDAECVRALTGLGWYYNNARRWEEALASFEQALKVDANTIGALGGSGWALCGMMRWDEALARSELALQLNPDYSNAQSVRQWALERDFPFGGP